MADKTREDANLKKKIQFLTDLINSAKQGQVRQQSSSYQPSLSKSKTNIQGNNKYIKSSSRPNKDSQPGPSLQIKSQSQGPVIQKNPFSISRTNTIPAGISTLPIKTDTLPIRSDTLPPRTKALVKTERQVTNTITTKTGTHPNTFPANTDTLSSRTGTPVTKAVNCVTVKRNASVTQTDSNELSRNLLAESLLSRSGAAKQTSTSGKQNIGGNSSITKVKVDSVKEVLPRKEEVKEKHTETNESLDLNQHSLSSLKKLLASKLEAKKQRANNRVTEKVGLKSKLIPTVASVDNSQVLSSGGSAQHNLTVPHQHDREKVIGSGSKSSKSQVKSAGVIHKKTQPTLSPVTEKSKVENKSSSFSSKLSSESVKLPQIISCVSSNHAIANQTSVPARTFPGGAALNKTTAGSQSLSNATAIDTRKTVSNKSQSSSGNNKTDIKRRVDITDNRSDLASPDLLSKGDLAKELKNTEAKIKELTADLTKLKQAAILVSASPKKRTDRSSGSSGRKLTSGQLLRKQTSSSSSHSSGSLVTKKHGQSKAQYAAKYIVSKYKLNKVAPKKTALVNSKLSSSLYSARKQYPLSAHTAMHKKSAGSKANMYSWNNATTYVHSASHNLSTYPRSRSWKSYSLPSRNFRQNGKLGSKVWMPIWKRQRSYINPSGYIKKSFSRWSKLHGSVGKSRLKVDNRVRGHVYIGGVLYKSSKRKLTKKGTLSTSGRTITVRGVRFHMGAGGKTLQRVDSKDGKRLKSISRVDFGGATYVETRPGTLEKRATSHSRFRINRAVHKSIAITMGKSRLKKTNKQYCMFFNRFGKCNRGDKCQYIHDPDKVAVCTRFLRGTCKVKNCPFSHKVSKDKMPVCSYFLRGLCVRDDCPYRHVNVGKDAKVCDDFLKGFCPQGEKCKKKHILECPEFAKTGNCSDGKKCKLLHRKREMKRRIFSNKSTAPQSKVPVYRTNNDEVEESTSTDQADDDDVVIPFKKRKLPAFISIASSDETTESPASQGPSTSAKKSQGSLRIKPIFQ